eukprot:COSAG02_NODE_709_length_18217_cov_13.019704_5_plen_124_part_00
MQHQFNYKTAVCVVSSCLHFPLLTPWCGTFPAGHVDFVPKQASKSARPAGAMVVVVNAIEATGLKTDPDHLSSAVMPKMDMGVLHAHDGTVLNNRPVPVQRITAVRPLHSHVASFSVSASAGV